MGPGCRGLVLHARDGHYIPCAVHELCWCLPLPCKTRTAAAVAGCPPQYNALHMHMSQAPLRAEGCDSALNPTLCTTVLLPCNAFFDTCWRVTDGGKVGTPPRQAWARTGPRSPQTPSKRWHSHLVQDDELQVCTCPREPARYQLHFFSGLPAGLPHRWGLTTSILQASYLWAPPGLHSLELCTCPSSMSQAREKAGVQAPAPRPSQEPLAGKQAAGRAQKPGSAEPPAGGPAATPRRARAAKRPAGHSDTESEDLLSPHGWDAASCPSEGSTHPRKGWGRTRRRTDGMVSPALLGSGCAHAAEAGRCCT